LRGQRRLYGLADAVVVHSEHGRDRLTEELGIEAGKVRVIPHGTFDYLTRLESEQPLDPELEHWLGEGPVALFFGLMRPYKGIDILLRAWRDVPGESARLVIAGGARMDLAPLEALADERVRFLPRFVTDPEIPALFRRAQVVVLPYREIEQSGVLFTALAFARATIATRVGGFTEVGERDGAVRLVEPDDPDGLGTALAELLHDADARQGLEAAASRAAVERYSWARAARDHLDLYRELAA
jgi:glycosyltransferase involved in cell wall biosynthesis